MENKRNPNNDQNPLYRALTRLLSGPLTDRRKQNPRQLKRKQLNKYKFTSPGGLSFKKESYTPFDNFRTSAYQNVNRAERYIDFDQMEYMPEIASGLDIYADEMTTSSAIQKLLLINCPNEEIKEILSQLFYEVLNIEFNIFGWCRSMCKYGDMFLYLDINEELGITNVIGLPSMEVERMEGEDKTNPNYVQFQWNSGGLTFENWQIGHFRILGNDKYAPYGTSVLEPCRRIWRQLQLLEDAMMAYRVVRSPERRVFYVDVGGIPEKEIEQHMQRIVTQMKRNQVIDSQTGRVDLRYNPMSVDEDYFIPVRGGSSNTRVESLPGGTYTGDVDDVKYLRDKLFSALKVPPSYLTQSDEGGDEKTTLAQKDVRFARTIQRLQRSVVAELEKIAVVHLYTLGFKGKDLLSFKLHLNCPSKIAELQELEHWRTKFEIAGAATEGYFSKQWVAKNLLNLSDEEIVRNQREMFYDKKFEAMLEASAEADGGEAGGEAGGDDFGDDDFGDDLGDDLGDEEEGDEDETLLAEPGKRNDMKWRTQNPKPHHTPNDKGKSYIPEKHDDREEAGRRKNMMGKVASEMGKNTQRNVFPGLDGFKQQYKGIKENAETNYIEESKVEFEVLRNSREIQQIIENLDKRENTKNGKI